MVLLSVAVEYIPVKTASRLTDFLARTLFHSMSGNSGTRFGIENSEFGEFEVKGMVLDHFPGEFLTGSEEYVICGFGREPGK